MAIPPGVDTDEPAGLRNQDQSRLSPHALRRTVGTQMAKLGLPTHVRSLALNHSPMSRGITDAVYNRYAYDREKREVLMAWEERLHQLITTPTKFA